MAALLDNCRFKPTLGGTTDWIYSSAVAGCQSPAAAGAVNGKLYKYRAESDDLTQWEIGEGAYNSGTTTFARTTVLFNSSGTTSKINFTSVPQVAVVALKEDLIAIDEANSFSTAQKAQAQTNIFVSGPTTQTLTSGTTYTTPANVKWIEVFINGGCGGGGGSGTSGQTGGGAGGTTTFNSVNAVGGSGGNPAAAATAGQFGGGGGAGGTGTAIQRSAGQSGGGGGTGVSAVTNGLPGIGGSGGGSHPGNGGAGASPAGNGVGGAGGGGGGEQAYLIISNPAASYSYAIGAAGTAGSAGTGGNAGSAGSSGSILVIEHYS